MFASVVKLLTIPLFVDPSLEMIANVCRASFTEYFNSHIDMPPPPIIIRLFEVMLSSTLRRHSLADFLAYLTTIWAAERPRLIKALYISKSDL